MTRRWRPLRSLRNRLALLFFAVTAVALAVVVFFFLPRLEQNIVAQKLSDLRKVAASATPQLQRVVGTAVTPDARDKLIRTVSDRSNARVTLLGVQQSTNAPPRFYVLTDSNQEAAVEPDLRLA